MTTEEKAKAYDETLERARKKYNSKYHPSEGPSGVYLNNADLEEIFPELAESEDERIIKKLQECVKNRNWSLNGPTQDEVFAWLERQKAKKQLDRMAPIYNDKESFEFALEKAWKYYNESASKTVDSFEDDYIECVFSKGFREGFLYKEKQKEQKLEMSDGEIEDKKRDIVAAIRKYYPADYAAYLTSFLKGLSPEDNSADEYGQKMLGIAYKLMYEHIPESLRTQEFWDSLKFMREYTGRVAIIHPYEYPAKWSEEDEKFGTKEPRDNWEYIKEFCDKFGRIPKDMDELDVLVSYVIDKKQKEQKPAEQNNATINGEPIPTENQSVDIPLPEWSEQHIADIFEKVGLAKIVREQGNDDLTNALQDAMLELSKVGNAELNEEDERMLRRCIKSVESSKNFADSQTFKEAKDKEKEWLISLPERFNHYNECEQYPIEDCDYGLEIAYDILKKTFGKVRGYQTDDGIREHQTAIKAVKDAMEEQKTAE